jgi:hypothetical protein
MPAIHYNLPGMGIKLNFGYSISKHFSIIFASGYMTRPTYSFSYLGGSACDYNVKDY